MENFGEYIPYFCLGAFAVTNLVILLPFILSMKGFKNSKSVKNENK